MILFSFPLRTSILPQEWGQGIDFFINRFLYFGWLTITVLSRKHLKDWMLYGKMKLIKKGERLCRQI